MHGLLALSCTILPVQSRAKVLQVFSFALWSHYLGLWSCIWLLIPCAKPSRSFGYAMKQVNAVPLSVKFDGVAHLTQIFIRTLASGHKVYHKVWFLRIKTDWSGIIGGADEHSSNKCRSCRVVLGPSSFYVSLPCLIFLFWTIQIAITFDS